MRRRSWLGIYVDILEVTRAPSNKMKIMYKSNLNFERFHRYFKEMLKKGFVEEKNGVNGRLVYKITPRGKDLLEVLKEAQRLAFS